jgi:fluoride exporter
VSGPGPVGPDQGRRHWLGPEREPIDPEQEPGARPGPVALGAVAVGGAFGTWVRALATLRHPAAADAIPWAVLWVNLVGSAALGLGLETMDAWLPGWHSFRALFAAGICGGLTTFSTLTVGADLLAYHGHSGTALAYLALSVLLGLLAAGGGVVLGRAVARFRS